MRRAARALAALALTFAAAPAGAHELHAIVAGFNRYQHLQKLLGAEADAADIAGVLKKRGVRDLVTFSDPSTKVAAFQSAWAAMVAKAAPGDTLMLTFAGHGIRVPETRTPRRTPDGFDKGFVFPTYDQDGAPDELLRDEDLYDLFKAAALRNLHVVFVADACHAGSGIRGTSPTAPVRFQRFNLRGDENDKKPAPAATDAPAARPPLRSVAVLSAQIQEKAIAEISVDGETRGALSYAVARGLEGAAAPEGGGAITVQSLYDYVRPIVRTRSGFSQAPTLYDVAADADMPVIAKPEAPKAVAAATQFPALKPVKLFTVGSAPPRTTRSIVVQEASTAELIFDAKRGLLLGSTGDVLAFDFTAADVDNAVAARQMLNALQSLADRDGALSLSLSGGDKLYLQGDRVGVKIATEPFDNVAIFDLTAAGKIMWLYPREKDNPVSHSASPLAVEQVVAPFGADYVVVLRSSRPLDLLTGAFSAENHFVIDAVDALPAMRAALDGAQFRVGIQGLFTCRRANASGQCDVQASSSP